MNKLSVFFLAAVFAFSACRSVPRRELDTREGVIAAHFSVPVKDVTRLMDKGYSEEECVKILFISSSTYLTEKEVIQKLKEGQSFEEISAGAGIEAELFRDKTRWILEQSSSYLEKREERE